MKTKKIKQYSLEEVTDKYIGKPGTKEREDFEDELRLDLIGEAIKKARKDRNLTQAELGKLVGVQKAQISKIENNLNDARFETILKVFKALNAKISFNVELMDNNLELN
ncbi:MAG TPA: helix-turn-helix transcriptional regulator [Salegentibacter sp.]|uniref:helix-turn-helix domain-containing protein n=1 Tax=Salegentibacter sp. TaxID=1903072 RepID=UPI002F957840